MWTVRANARRICRGQALPATGLYSTNRQRRVNCMLCIRRAQLDDVEEGAPPQSDAGQATAAGDDSCSTVAWEEPGEEVVQEL